MKKFKYIIVISLILFSFFLTDRIIIFTENRNPLMKEIIKNAHLFQTESVNAVVSDNTVVPGISGKEVSVRRSYIKMGEFGFFNENFLAFDDIRPDISLYDSLDKVIVSGNSAKREVAFVLEESNTNEEIFNKGNIQYSIIANTKTDLSIPREYINGEIDLKKRSDLNFLLNRRKINKKICLVNYSDIEYCQQKKQYIVSPSIDTKDNITDNLTKIRSGDIILIRKSSSANNINLLIKEIRRQNLSPVTLSKLISETH